MANAIDIIKTRSSIRAYKNEKITEEQLKSLLEAGLLAPTARNEQELHFSVITCDNEIMKELDDDLPFDMKVPFHYNASHFIVISGADAFPWSAVDAGIAVENIHLAAASLGLGSVIIGIIGGVMKGEKKAYYNEKLAIPEGYTYQIAIAVGVPDTTKEPHGYDFEKNVTIL